MALAQNASLLSAVNCSAELTQHKHHTEMHITSFMYTAVSPVLFILGIFGNFMVYVVIGNVCPGTTTSIHFRNLAIFDTISAFIIVLLPFTHYAFGLHIMSASRVTCAGFTFLRYVAGDVAIWLVLVITVDRLFAVWKPLKVRTSCMTKNAPKMVFVLLLLAVIKNGHIAFVRGLLPEVIDPCGPILDNNKLAYDCTTLKESATMYFYEKKVRPIIALVTVSIIPVFGVAFCNAFITTLVCRNSKQWQLALNREKEASKPVAKESKVAVTSSLESIAMANNTPKVDRTKKHKNATSPADKKSDMAKRMAKSERNSLILSVTNSTAYFLFVLPSFLLCLFRHEIQLEFIVADVFREDMLLAMTDALIVANHTLNFYICCAASKSFRQKVLQFVRVTCERFGLKKKKPAQLNPYSHSEATML